MQKKPTERDMEYLNKWTRRSAITHGISDERLMEICEAERAGRCVVLPVKPHDNAFVIHSGVIDACIVEGVYFTGRKNYVRLRPIIQSYVGNRSLFYTPLLSSYGKVFFRNREAADAALKQNNE